MTLPNFIIIGAQKCGTTSLYNYMIEHPQILPASMKELHFFNWRSKPGRNGNKKFKWYLQQFPEIVDGENIITGEATPDYFVDPSTPQKMFELLPKVKLIVLLRNPVDRAISHYYHNRSISQKREPLSFKKAIEKEPERLKIEKEKLLSDENYRSLFHRNYSYLERGVYIEQLEKWMSVFPREQFLIIKSEDFYGNRDATLKEVFNFLGLPNHQIKNQKKYNQGSSSKSIQPEIRSSLVEYFKPYNQRLEDFLGRKFNWENSGKNVKENSSQVKIRETPLLTTEAVQLIENLLDKKPDAKVLEFGSGGSTIWLSKKTKNLISIEHNAKWYKIVKNHIQPENSCNPVDLKLRSQEYHTICEKFPDELFDLIIVDGRDRVKCVEASIRVLKPGGILMLNDAQKKGYKPVHNLLNNWDLTQTVSASRPGHTYWWQKPLNKMREKCTLSMCAIMKNEGSYLKEWLEFHKLVGVERFYLYDNNSTDNTRDIIRPYLDTGEVIIKHWPINVGQQMAAYTDFLENYKHESEWIAFIDLDEFLFPTLGNDLKEVLKEFVDYPAVGVNWLIFGSSGHETKPEGLQMESYTYRGKNDFKANLNFKSIVRSDQTISCLGPHHFTYINNGVAVTENLEPLLGKVSEKHSVSKLRINHYFTRSKEESKKKVQRGRATVKSKRKLSFVLMHDRNDVEDLTIQRFLPQLKSALTKTSDNPQITEKCKLSICAIMKNEGPYLVEWLEFHKLVGVERFYLYDNESTDNTKEIISSYIDSGEVIYCYWPQRPGQLPAYSHCLENHKQESEWIAFIDLDEFLFPTKADDIKEVLDEFVEAPALAVNWLLFGNSHHETKPEGLQIENFIKRSKNSYGPNKTVKCIVHPEQTVKPVSPHQFIYLNDLAVTENQQPVNRAFSPKHSVNKLRINHYHTRSREESFQKMMRGKATKNEKRDWSHFESKEHIFNEVKDLAIQRFIPKLKKAIEKVNASLPQLQKTSQTANLLNPLIATSPQSKEVIPTQGNLDKSLIQNQNLLLVGWVASINYGPVDGFKVAIAGQEITKFDLTLGLPSPGVNKLYSHLDNASLAKFRLKLPIEQEYRDSLIALTPLFNHREGGLILAVKDPSIPIPSTKYIKNFDGISSQEFIATGFKWLSYLIQRVDLKPTDHILDIGCGLGNIAYALTSYLKSPGRYEGFDMVDKPLKWLQQEISTGKPNFKFRFVDVYHPIYYPEGKVPLTEFIFPYPDQTFDVVCLRDIFTHLQADGVRQYLTEISRVLKPGGKCLFSCFLLNSESEDLTAKGKSSKKFVHQLKDCFTANLKKPEVSIGYQESDLQKLIIEQDLNAISKFYGSWCGRISFTKPDLLILQKNSTSNPLENLEPESIEKSKSQLQQMKKSLNHYQKKLQKIQKQVTEAPQQN